MQPGRSLSIGAVAASATACAVAASLYAPLSGAALGMGPAIGAAAIGTALAAAIALPVGLLIDSQLKRLRGGIRAASETETAGALPDSGLLAGVVDELREAFERLESRARSAESRLREVEINLKLSEAERQHAETVIQSLHDAVIVTDAYNELTMANERAAALLGFKLDAAMHRPIHEIVHDEGLQKLIREACSVGSPSHCKHIEHALHACDSEDEGRGAHYDVTLACLPAPDDNGSGVVTILRDVTREREISQMKSEFVSKASHELRTPLSSINAYIELLLDGEADTEEGRQEFYQIIKNEADRLGRLIDNMLNISRIEAGIVKVNPTEVDFVRAAHAAMEVIAPQAKLKDITVGIHSGPLAYTAMADADMIHQVLLNLMSNAVKYTPEGGRMTVTIEDDDATQGVMVTVADTGFGIPPDAIDKVFDKFYRIENYKRVAKGTGLGLNLVKHIVETVHKGHVAVSSELGMGSRFTFTIPYKCEGA